LLPLALGFIGIAVSGIQGSRASASICFDLFEQQLGTKLKSGAESFDLIETLLIKCLSEGMKSFPPHFAYFRGADEQRSALLIFIGGLGKWNADKVSQDIANEI